MTKLSCDVADARNSIDFSKVLEAENDEHCSSDQTRSQVLVKTTTRLTTAPQRGSRESALVILARRLQLVRSHQQAVELGSAVGHAVDDVLVGYTDDPLAA